MTIIAWLSWITWFLLFGLFSFSGIKELQTEGIVVLIIAILLWFASKIDYETNDIEESELFSPGKVSVIKKIFSAFYIYQCISCKNYHRINWKSRLIWKQSANEHGWWKWVGEEEFLCLKCAPKKKIAKEIFQKEVWRRYHRDFYGG